MKFVLKGHSYITKIDHHAKIVKKTKYDAHTSVKF